MGRSGQLSGFPGLLSTFLGSDSSAKPQVKALQARQVTTDKPHYVKLDTPVLPCLPTVFVRRYLDHTPHGFSLSVDIFELCRSGMVPDDPALSIQIPDHRSPV